MSEQARTGKPLERMVMAEFQPFQDGVEVTGECVLAIVEACMVKSKILEILEENGIENPKAGQWYPQIAWLNAFHTIADTIGRNTLDMIGRKIPEMALFPPEIDSLVKAMLTIDEAYHMNHRYGEIGSYDFELTEGKSGKMTCRNPYPCEFDRGIIEAMAQRFKPLASDAVHVTHDSDAPCRKNGGEACTYIITW
jgi:hypothetical protein